MSDNPSARFAGRGEDGRMRPPTRINDRDCGWCGAVAMRGPFKHPDYDTEWYLCPSCAEDVDGMEPAAEPLGFDTAHYPVTVKVGGKVVARYSGGD